MISLLILILSGAWFAYFATQNTQHVTINLFNYTFANVPLYAIVLGALLIGVFISWIISFFGSISNSLTISGKNSKINARNKEIEKLNARIHDLELENENLKGKASVRPAI